MKIWLLIVFVMGQPEYGAPDPFPTAASCEQAGVDWDARKQPDQHAHVCVELEKDQ